MSSLSAGIKNETQKIFLRKKTMVFVLLTGAFPIGSAVLFSLLQEKSGISMFDNVNYPLFVLGAFVNVVLPLFIFMTASDVFAGEEGDKTIKLVLTRPISRLHVFVSKTSAVAILILIHLFVIFVTSFVSGLDLAGSHGLFGVFESMKAYVVSAIPMISLAIAGVFLSQFFRSASAALTSCILAYIAIKVLPLILPSISKLLPFSYTDWYALWLGHTAGAGNIFQAFMFVLSYSILFFVGGFYLFDRKEW
ncbi:ABC transporter permease subunit [Aneurinibacillus sp. Ricciae_BoGa-3]|uniref:ABC transporter permease n=1 Tax=Aneurinibacillus sp. Ricciae_BoGa-3 TaxID=3022697 RepID=UPI00233FC718|nr:ABC transporter permease subunit [Aneurinibacillus sp. Ricciae_BoGa-3]WCK56515.1 ABC transporter permease subunit [Aneurinibacillus sp. Ricciae_BoGa-3]